MTQTRRGMRYAVVPAMKHHEHEDVTLQDDRATLELDAYDDSPLLTARAHR
jgi:hypothetical protein